MYIEITNDWVRFCQMSKFFQIQLETVLLMAWKIRHTSANAYLEVSESQICPMGCAGFYHLKVSSLVMGKMEVCPSMVLVIISVHETANLIVLPIKTVVVASFSARHMELQQGLEWPRFHFCLRIFYTIQ